ncbi:MAG: amidohydrolase family protein [Gemmatimonadota bacterium]
MWTLIEDGEVYGPSPLGRQSLLVMGERIASVGRVDRREVEALGVELEVVDATGCTVIPGIVDPHLYLLGESGPQRPGDRPPAALAADLAAAGVTTAVGCLGAVGDTTAMKALLARARSLRGQGPDVHVWTGGGGTRATLLESACGDLVTFADVIGAGAIADSRGSIPDPRDLASLASDAYLGGTLSGKRGVTHFHLGGSEPVSPLLEALDEQRVPPDRIFAMLRGPAPGLLDGAVRCAEWGAFVGVGAEGGDLGEWVRGYLDRGGNARRLTLSSGAPRARPRSTLERVFTLAGTPGWPLEAVLPWATANPARMLGLDDRGTIEPGRRADLVVLRRDPLRVAEVIAAGRRIVREGAPCVDPNLQ